MANANVVTITLLMAVAAILMSAPTKAVTCGGTVDLNPSGGSITSPNYPNEYQNNVNCNWFFWIPNRHIIRFKFKPPFELESGSDFVKIFETLSSGQREQRGSWSGNSTPPVYTSRNGISKLELVFTTDGSVVNTGFSVTWEDFAMDDCRQNFTTDTGNLSSFDFGGNYLNHLDCEWFINGTADRGIRLFFDSLFDIESSNDGECSYDYLEISEVLPSRSLVRKDRFCGTKPPPTIASYNPGGYVVRFHSDEDKTGAGFSLSWDTSDVCGKVVYLTPDTGFMTSPNYPSPYLNYGSCRWTISVPREKVARITFNTPFDLESPHDSVTIFETLLSGRSEQRGRWSGTSPPIPPVYTSRNDISALYIVFVTDHTVVKTGINMTWEYLEFYDCKKTFTEDTGNLSLAADLGGNYENNMDCEWLIDGTANHVIHLFFNSLDIESSNDGNCSYDYLEVLDVLPSGSLVSRGRFCGTTTPPTLVSSSNRAVVRFRSDEEKSGAGFSLSWDTACGDVFQDLEGNVTSPFYPDPYPHNFDCRWQMQVPDGYLIKLKFMEPFHIEGFGSCDTDYLEVFDYTASSRLVSKGKWCGSALPPNLASITSRLLLIFHSDGDKSYAGFKAVWESVATRLCGEVFNYPKGQFTSPEFPSIYPDNLDCRWEVNVGRGQRVKLEFGPVFDLERDNEGNCYDDVEVLDVLSNGTLVSEGRWCSMPKTREFYSTSTTIVVLFKSDMDKGGRGFSASWTSVSICGGTFLTEDGHLATPNFPRDYPKSMTCNWWIQPPGGSNVTLRFDNLFDVELSNGCSWDYVQMRLDGSYLGTWCGRSQPSDVEFLGGQRLQITFRSDKSNTGKGFYASWKSD